MEVNIITLSENTANAGFLGEWGLSILVITEDIRILLDTGGVNLSAIYNAQVLGIELSSIDKIVLSHGHRDHTGGLHEILRRIGPVDVIAHPGVWDSKYVRIKGKELYAGIPFKKEALESLGASFNLTKKPVRLSKDIMTTGEIPMITKYEKVDSCIYIKQENSLFSDSVADDNALIIDTKQGLIVVVGCAHRGIINTLHHAQNLSGNRSIYAVVGGIHLFRESKSRIESTVEALKQMEVERLYVSHCTGFQASCLLAQEFGDNFLLNNAGTCLTLL